MDSDFLAVEGDDGRYHLQRGTTLMCRGVRVDTRRTGVVHKQWCCWWSDGNQYRIQAPRGASGLAGRYQERIVAWRVRLTGKVTAPDLVPPQRRCPEGAHVQWPAHLAGTKPLVRIRRRALCRTGGRRRSAVA